MDNKLEIIKSIRDLEQRGVQFDKLYTIDNDLNELKFALDLGNNYLSKMIMNHKIEQLGQLVSIGLETINPKVAKESPLNPKNWNPEVWKLIKDYASSDYVYTINKLDNKNNQNNQNNIKDICKVEIIDSKKQ